MALPTPDNAAIASTIHWLAAKPEALDWASWDGEHVVFHRPSGKTHLVNAAAFHLLTRILVEPCALARVQSELEQVGIEQPEPDTLELLQWLDELGLVRAG